MINRKSAKVLTAPTIYPVSFNAVKSYLRIDGSDDDTLLGIYIQAATKQAENYCGRFFINTTIEYYMDRIADFNDDALDYEDLIFASTNSINLPYRPVSSITSIKTYDAANTESTLSSAAYSLDSITGRVYLNQGYGWPTSLRTFQGVKVTFVSGYGTAATDVPAPIQQGILELVGKMYECRGGCDMPESCKATFSEYRILDHYGWV